MKPIPKKQTMVKRMREIHDQVSQDTRNISLAEERAYLAEQIKRLKVKRVKTNR